MRIQDKDKIKRIRTEAKKLIVEKGYARASIAELAKRSEVSDGYLYRHYKNKSEMVHDLLETQLKQFHDHVLELIDSKSCVKEVVEGLTLFLFKLSQQEPHAIPFAHSLVYDYEFEYPESRAKAIKIIICRLLELGQKTGEIAKHISEPDIMVTILTIPVKYVEYNAKNIFNTPNDETTIIENIVRLCMNSVM